MEHEEDQKKEIDSEKEKRIKSRKSTKSSRRRRLRQDRRESLANFNFNIPGVTRIVLSEKTQRFMGCVVGEDVTSEKPWKFIKKEMFEDHMELHEASEFFAIRLDIITHAKKEILIGYAPDETKDYDEFFVVLTETAEDKIKDVICRIREEQEKRLARAIIKKVRRWKSLGSEVEIDEYIEKTNRPLIEVEMEGAYPLMSPKVKFTFRSVEAVRDGYVELLNNRLEITFIPKLRIHAEVQVAPSIATAEAQTVCSYPKNVWTQYNYEFAPVKSSTEEFQNKLKDYLETQSSWLCDKIKVNHAINLYVDDYKELVTDHISQRSPRNIIWEEYMSFADLYEARNKMITSVCWHPIWTGTVVISYADYAHNTYKRYKSTTDEVNKIIHSANPVLIWCFNDGLHPKLFLESHRMVTSVSFCPFNENLIVGGLQNGQIVIWDIKNKLNKVEEEEILSTAQQKYRVLMFSLIEWMKHTRDFSRVRVTVESDVQQSHTSPVTGIKWMTPTWKITRTGQVEEIKEGEPHSLQIVSCATDGSILFWDLLAKPVGSVGDYTSNRKSRRLSIRPTALTLDVSPYRALNRLLRPQYRLTTHNIKKNKPLLLSCFELMPVCVNYEVPSTVQNYTLTERLICPPIITKPPGPPETMLFCSSLDGYFAYMQWDGYNVNPGDVIIQECCKIRKIGRYHDGPVTCIDRNNLCTDTYLTVGGKVFAIWKDSFPNRPIIWRKSRHRYLHGAWNLKNPAMLKLSRSDGNREVWYLTRRTDKMFYEQSLSGSSVLGSYTHPPRGNMLNILGVADSSGTFRIFYMPNALNESKDSRQMLETQLDREVQRKKAFIIWQNNWLKNNQDTVQERWANRLEYQRKREEKAIREKQRIVAERQRLIKDQMLAAEKSVPQPGHYADWAKDQWRIKEEERMNKVLLLKKQLNPNLLASQQMPLKTLQQEEERKKKRQREKLQKSDKIFVETVAMLFPDVIKKKPPPPIDPYAGSELIEDKRACMEEFVELTQQCKAYVRENAFEYKFDWHKIMQTGRNRKKSIDYRFATCSHKDRHENEKRLRLKRAINRNIKLSGISGISDSYVTETEIEISGGRED